MRVARVVSGCVAREVTLGLAAARPGSAHPNRIAVTMSDITACIREWARPGSAVSGRTDRRDLQKLVEAGKEYLLANYINTIRENPPDRPLTRSYSSDGTPLLLKHMGEGVGQSCLALRPGGAMGTRILASMLPGFGPFAIAHCALRPVLRRIRLPCVRHAMSCRVFRCGAPGAGVRLRLVTPKRGPCCESLPGPSLRA